MPRHSRHLLAWWLAGLIVPAVAWGQQYKIQLPPAPAGTQPVTVVKAMLEFDAPIPANSLSTPSVIEVSVESAGTTLTAPVAVQVRGGSAVPTPVGGDFVSIVGGGTNRLVLEINARRFLASPGSDLCTLAASPPPDLTFTLNLGASFVGKTNTGRRLTGFAAASSGHCTCPARRMKNVTWVSGFEPAGTDKGRFPMDLALVLDKSGSMLSPTPGDPTSTSKMLALQSAVGTFAAMWQLEGTGVGATGGTELSDDRLAVFFFDSTVTPVLGGGGVNYVPRGAGGSPHPWQTLNDQVQTSSAFGATAMGSGMRDAFNAHAANPSPVGNDLVMVVLTDGMQNVPPLVTEVAGVETLDFGASGGGVAELRTKCTPMLTVAVGNAAVPYADLMDKIAQQTAGMSRLTAGIDTPSIFADHLVTALKGNTLSVVLETKGNLPQSAPKVTHQVLLDSTVKSFLVTVNWLGARNSAAGVTVRAPDGTTVVRPPMVTGPTYTVYRINMPKTGGAGTWSLDVTRFGGGEFPDAVVPYQLGVYTDEKSLDMDLRFVGARHPTGKPLVLDAQLFFEGKRYEGDAKLVARVEGPITALGTFMHETPTPELRPQEGKDQLPPYQLKLDALIQKDPKLLAQLGTRKVGEFPLERQKNGSYQLQWTETKVPGTYRFFITLEMPGLPGETIRRVETVETKVEVVPDGFSSVVESKPGANGGFVLTFIPRDAFGNFKGPGYEDQVDVRLPKGGRLAGVTTPKISGAYEIQLVEVTPDTPIELAMNGQVVARGTVEKPEPVKPGEGGETGPGPGDGPTPKPSPDCFGCHRSPTTGATGMMSLFFLALVAQRLGRRRKDD